MPEKHSRVRLQLAAELQSCRRLAGVNQREMAKQVGVSQPLVSRIESAERLLSLPDVAKWLRACSAAPEVRERIIALTEAAHTETRTWRELLATTNHLQEEASRRNAAAALVQNFQPSILPGLVQTADYARATIPLTDLEGQIDRAAHLAARIERQAVLRDPGRRFDFLIAERLLRWEPAPGVLGPQLAQLAAVAALDTVTVAVLPDSYAGAIPWHNFVLRHPADGSPPYVAVEMVHGEQTIEDATDVAAYELLWKVMWEAALVGDEAIARIRAEGPTS